MPSIPWDSVDRVTRQGFTLQVPIQFGTVATPISLVGRDFAAVVQWPGGEATFALASSSLYVVGLASAGLLMLELADEFTADLPVSRAGEVRYEVAETTGGKRLPVIAGTIAVSAGLTAEI
jgi:hypothetical protein